VGRPPKLFDLLQGASQSMCHFFSIATFAFGALIAPGGMRTDKGSLGRNNIVLDHRRALLVR
jgi:hypothetical protein